ncbi:VOC family protein [Nocardia sp. NPDC057353]|uniref:VOC family protein n=1 Tax=Nocardia sp. NPDC057353 TaxID=3346104 RepID=UPI0036264A80
MTDNIGRLISFEIGSKNLKATQEFYEKTFGWTFTEGLDGPGRPYGFANTPEGSAMPFGTAWDTHLTPDGTDIPDEYIAIIIQVEDLKESCRLIEEAGGRITVPPTTNEDRTADVAHFRDPRGVLVGLFSLNMSPDSAPNPNPIPDELLPTKPLPDFLLAQRED